VQSVCDQSCPQINFEFNFSLVKLNLLLKKMSTEWDREMLQYVHRAEDGSTFVWSESDNAWVPHIAVVEEVAVCSAPTRATTHQSSNLPQQEQDLQRQDQPQQSATDANVGAVDHLPIAEQVTQEASSAAAAEDPLAAAERAFFEELGMDGGGGGDGGGEKQQQQQQQQQQGAAPGGDHPAASAAVDPADAFAAAAAGTDPLADPAALAARAAAAEAEAARKKAFAEANSEENRTVYFSNMHPEAAEADVEAFFARAGVLDVDIACTPPRPRLRLYTDRATGARKGDGVVTFLRLPSVRLAIDLLGGTEFMGRRVEVSEAVFGGNKKKRRRMQNGRPNAAGAIRSGRDAKRIALEGRDPRAQLLWDEDTYLDQTKGGRVVVVEGAYEQAEVLGNMCVCFF
jgi:hypothetical protein